MSKRGEKRTRATYEAPSERPIKGKFVLSVPMYIPEDMSDTSADESDDGTYAGKFDFNPKNHRELPYRTFKLDKAKKDTKSKKVKKVKISYEEVGSPSERDIRMVNTDELEEIKIKGSKVKDFLRKVQNEAFESYSSLEDISVSIGLNKKYSLSDRSNSSLKAEFKSALKVSSRTVVKHEVMAFFWNVQWYDQEDEEVPYDTAKKFYKQLKRKKPDLASEFLRINEEGVKVPYQELREVLRLHDQTKGLVALHREKLPSSPVYFVIMDSDVYNFNHAFSAYQRIVAGSMDSYPAVMSTGYLFSETQGWPALYASRVDMAIRKITAKHFGSGTYYPEPNTCALIPDCESTLPETFIDRKREGGAHESPVVLAGVLKRGEVKFVFSEDNALITSMPERCKNDKKANKKFGAKKLCFSDSFRNGGDPSANDIKQLKKMSQSHLDEKEWASSLYHNRGFKLKGNFRKFTSEASKLLCKYQEDIDADVSAGIAKLLEFGLTSVDVDKICSAAKEIAIYKKTHMKNLPNFNQLLEFARQDFKLPKKVNDFDVQTKEIIIELYEQYFEFTARLLHRKKVDITKIVDFFSSCSETKFGSIAEVSSVIDISNLNIEFISSLYDELSDEEIAEGIFLSYVKFLFVASDDFEEELDGRTTEERVTEINDIVKDHKTAFIELYSSSYSDIIDAMGNFDLSDFIRLHEEGIDIEEARKASENGLDIDDIISLHEEGIDIDEASRVAKNGLSIENIISLCEAGIDINDVLMLQEENDDVTYDRLIQLYQKGIDLEKIIILQEVNEELNLSQIYTLVVEYKISLESLIKLSEENRNVSLKDIEGLRSVGMDDIDRIISLQDNDESLTLDQIYEHTLAGES